MRPQFRNLNALGKMMTFYLQDTNEFLKLFKNNTKMQVPDKKVWEQMERFGEACTTSSCDKFQLVQSCFVTYIEKIEEFSFFDEESLHRKINNRDIYM